MDVVFELLEEFVDSRKEDVSDEIIDVLQEVTPLELREICKNAWLLKLIITYCDARK